MKTVAFLPAKGNSDRIGNKNVRLLDGKPLFLHTLDKLLACDFIDEVCLDTESAEIAAMAAERSCRVLMRDPTLASNATDGNRLFMNQVRQVEADIYIQALCTSPFIEPDTMRRGVETLAQPGTAHDSAVLVRKERLYTWRDGRLDGLRADERRRAQRLDVDVGLDLPHLVVEQRVAIGAVAGERGIAHQDARSRVRRQGGHLLGLGVEVHLVDERQACQLLERVEEQRLAIEQPRVLVLDAAAGALGRHEGHDFHAEISEQ